MPRFVLDGVVMAARLQKKEKSRSLPSEKSVDPPPTPLTKKKKKSPIYQTMKLLLAVVGACEIHLNNTRNFLSLCHATSFVIPYFRRLVE